MILFECFGGIKSLIQLSEIPQLLSWLLAAAQAIGVDLD